ncbi:MAG: hypothetical protein LJE94_18055 [Deltaproteobacteria bacterium]|nr:hypothetical protein [Deltaproteobacteria bacterium]
MRHRRERAVIRVVVATGISSVVTQLITIREFITQFSGNEIVIALILFNWLILGGAGTLAARAFARRSRPTPGKLAGFSLLLCILALLQIMAIRQLRNLIFTQGSSVGFYPVLLFCLLTLAPYCLLLGFVLPYSLFVLRSERNDYPASRIYIGDNIGDIAGGALFSFVLIFLVSPMTALLIGHVPLILASYMLFPSPGRNRPVVWSALILALATLGSGIALENVSLTPAKGRLALYRETRYGRITVHRDREQFTLFENGIPMFSSHDRSTAEETVHYPLSQLDTVRKVLLISARGGVMDEIKKYPIQSVDYVELDPEVAAVQFRFGIIHKVNGLHVIHQDGRVFLSQTPKKYDAIIVNLPEPDTFQLNRFYTNTFFKMARRHLAPQGVLSFSMQGFDNYLAESQRRKLSALYHTAHVHFEHVTLFPGQKVYFVCSRQPPHMDIPAVLERKGIPTTYISGYFYGNVTPERIDALNQSMDPSVPRNIDQKPYLMRLMFSQWFAKFQTSPTVFFLVIGVLAAAYVARSTREEFILFSTGGMVMGSEILVIFAFQIYFGYIYSQIGIIVTVFLTGLLPGAWFGNRLCERGKPALIVSDLFLIVLLALFILVIYTFADRLPEAFYLAFGFAVSLACGFQFPVALHLKGGGNTAIARAFSADLIGAACGTLMTSVILIPYSGIFWTAGGLIAIKVISLALIPWIKVKGAA